MLQLTNKEKEDLLHLACENSQISLIKTLLKCNVNTNSINAKGLSPLHVAAINGNVEVTRLLVNEGANLEMKDSKCGSSPFLHACQNGRVKIVRLLIANGANIKAVGMNGTNALHFAAESGNVELVEMLIDNFPNVNATDADGTTVLQFAAISGNVKVLDILIGRGADLNAQNRLNFDALHFAARYGNVQATIYLIKKGCDIYSRNCHNNTFLQEVFCSQFAKIDENGRIAIIEALLNTGADVNSFELHSECYGRVPLLTYAIIDRNMEDLSTILILNGADINIKLPFFMPSFSMFFLAVLWKSYPISKAILDVHPHFKDNRNLNLAESSLDMNIEKNGALKVLLNHYHHY